MVGVEAKGERKTVSTIEGDLRLEDSEISSDAPDNTVRVSGATICRGDCVFNCSLATRRLEGDDIPDISVKNLSVERTIRLREGELTVHGDLSAHVIDMDRDLTVHGDMECSEVHVGGSIRVKGSTKCELIDLARSLRLGSNTEVVTIRAGGDVEFAGPAKCESISSFTRLVGYGRLEADRVGYGESVRMNSEVKLGQIGVGGSVKVAGGVIEGQIGAGGTFESTAPLRFDTISTAGKVTLSGGQGRHISAIYSMVSSHGDLTFETIDAYVVGIKGNASGQRIDAQGSVDISGDLKLTGSLRTKDKAEVGGILQAGSIRVGGLTQAKRVEAKDIEANELITDSGAKAELIEIVRKGRAKGPIMGGSVVIGDMARVQDIFAEDVQLRRGCRARNIYATRICVEPRVRISGEVKYSDMIDTEDYGGFAHEPEKVRKLPGPPSA